MQPENSPSNGQTSSAPTKLKDLVENHPVFIIATVAIAAFLFGWGVNEALLKASNSRVISQFEYDRLKTDSDELHKSQKEINEKAGAEVTKRRVRVVFVDTRSRLYVKRGAEAYQDGNADFLTRHIEHNEQLNKLIEPIKMLPAVPAPGSDPLRFASIAQDVEQQKPDLVVIHRSVFLAEKETDPEDEKLIAFLKGIKMPNVMLVLYSRRDNTDGLFAADIENKTSLNGRIYPYKFRGDHPFDDKNQVDHFLNTVLLLAHAQLDSR